MSESTPDTRPFVEKWLETKREEGQLDPCILKAITDNLSGGTLDGKHLVKSLKTLAEEEAEPDE